MAKQEYVCSICGYRTGRGDRHTWGETAMHFWREIVMGEKMELIPVQQFDNRSADDRV